MLHAKTLLARKDQSFKDVITVLTGQFVFLFKSQYHVHMAKYKMTLLMLLESHLVRRIQR